MTDKQLRKKIAKAKAIKSRCRLVDVEPPRWVVHLVHTANELLKRRTA